MKTISLTVILACAYLAGAAQGSDEKGIIETVNSLNQAMLDGNEAVLKDLTAEELSYGHSSGNVEDQSTFVKNLASGQTDFKAIDSSDQTISITDNIAIVRHRLKCDLIAGGNQLNLTLAVLQVWQKQHGKWKLLARQATKL